MPSMKPASVSKAYRGGDKGPYTRNEPSPRATTPGGAYQQGNLGFDPWQTTPGSDVSGWGGSGFGGGMDTDPGQYSWWQVTGADPPPLQKQPTGGDTGNWGNEFGETNPENPNIDPGDPYSPGEFGPGGPGEGYWGTGSPWHTGGGVLRPPGYTKPWTGNYGDEGNWGNDLIIGPGYEEPGEPGAGYAGNVGTGGNVTGPVFGGGASNHGLTYGNNLLAARGKKLCDPNDPNCYG